MFRDIVGKVAAPDLVCAVFLAELQREISRRRGCTTRVSDTRLEFKGSLWYVRMPGVHQLPGGVATGAVEVIGAGESTEIAYSLSLWLVRTICAALSCIAVYAGLHQTSVSAAVGVICLGLLFAWGLIYGLTWLGARSGFRSMLEQLVQRSVQVWNAPETDEDGTR